MLFWILTMCVVNLPLKFLNFGLLNPDLSFSPLQFPIFMECTDFAPSKPLGPTKAPKLPKSAAMKEMPPVEMSAGQTLIMSLTLTLPEGTKLTEEAPSCWALSAEGEL